MTTEMACMLAIFNMENIGGRTIGKKEKLIGQIAHTVDQQNK